MRQLTISHNMPRSQYPNKDVYSSRLNGKNLCQLVANQLEGCSIVSHLQLRK